MILEFESGSDEMQDRVYVWSESDGVGRWSEPGERLWDAVTNAISDIKFAPFILDQIAETLVTSS